jgi:O-antigen/teichoic acid export membrane protein
MRNKLKAFSKSQLFKGTLALLWGAAIVNIANYLFNLVMGRMLGPVEFGSLSAVLSILYILLVISNSIGTVSTRFSAECHAENNIGKAKFGLFKFTKGFFLLSVGAIILLFIFSEEISNFLHLESSLPVIAVLPYVFMLFLIPIPRGILNGFQKFNAASAINVVEVSIKFCLSVLLVFAGLKVPGAVLSIGIATSVAYVCLAWPLRSVLSAKAEDGISFNKFFTTFNWAFLAMLGFSLFQSLDVLLAKHFLSSFDAGLYAGVSLLGKIIFFGTTVVTTAMFPIVAEKHYAKERHTPILFQALAIVSIISLIITLAYALMPKLIVTIFLGHAYLDIVKFVPYFGVSMMFLSISSVFFYYFLSIRARKLKLIPLYIIPIMIIGLYLFHDSLKSVVLVQLSSTAALLFSFVVGFVTSNWREIVKRIKGPR